MDAYLDIEISYRKEITICGIFREDEGVIQLVYDKVTRENIIETLQGIKNIYTYNGKKFDIPVIAELVGLDLFKYYQIYDLMYDCRKYKLFGGLKKVEKLLGIPRKLEGMDGKYAMELWERYVTFGDKDAFNMLLEYNKEDVVNLKILKERLKMLRGIRCIFI